MFISINTILQEPCQCLIGVIVNILLKAFAWLLALEDRQEVLADLMMVCKHVDLKLLEASLLSDVIL